MKIKLGPVTTEYAGTARVQDVDEDDHVASYRVEGREARGQGSAAAATVVCRAGLYCGCLRSEGRRRVNRVRTSPVAALSDVRCRFGVPGALHSPSS